jgi:Zn-dependent protease
VLDWSFKLYTAFGITVRMHWLFPLFIVVEFLKATHIVYWAIVVGILFLQVLCHEYGHALTARRVMAGCDSIVIWPLGGAAYCGRASNYLDDMKVTFMGPAINSLFFVGGLATLAALGLWNLSLLNPWATWYPYAYHPDYSMGAQLALNALVISTKLGMILTAFNLLLPAYPLDGGRLLLTYVSAHHGRERAARVSSTIGLPVGVGLMVWAVLRGGTMSDNMLLFLLGLWVLMDNYNLRRMAAAGALDQHPAFPVEAEWASLTYREEPARKPGFFERWRRRRAAEADRRRHEEDALIRAKADQVLDKVAREGMHSLTPEERRILEEASRKMRGE